MVSRLAAAAAQEGIKRLTGDPVQKELTRSLKSGVEGYVGARRSPVYELLVSKKGVLMHPPVHDELARLLAHGEDPRADVIADQWRRLAGTDGNGWDFDTEAARLLLSIRNALLLSPVLAPMLTARATDRLARCLAPPMRELITPFDVRMAELTQGFVGRQFVFDEVEKFVARSVSGYCFITGDPGAGKSAVAARLVQQRGYVRHFNNALIGLTQPKKFLANVCAQLVDRYQLGTDRLGADAVEDGSTLQDLLAQVAARYGEQVVVVDALDESDLTQLRGSANPLYLPPTLPDGVHMVVTARRDSPALRRLSVQTEHAEVEIGRGVHSDRDVREFVQSWADRPAIRGWMSARGLDDTGFVELLTEKADGNFQYLRYVLPDIEAGKWTGEEIPAKLGGYYRWHWQQMWGGTAEELKAKKRVLVAMCLHPETPLSRNMLGFFADVDDPDLVDAVLLEWGQFLRPVRLGGDPESPLGYRLYHKSFLDFLTEVPEMEGAFERAADALANQQTADP